MAASVQQEEDEEDLGGLTNVTESFVFALKCLDFLNFYYLAVVIFFGMVGNTLSFLVFTQTHLKLRSSSYYLAALALADLWFLLTLLVVWLDHFDIDLFNRQGFCQAMVYGSSVSSCLSVWLTVAFTVERLIAVQYPLQRPFMCTVRRAKIIISVLTFFTLALHTYSLFTSGITIGREGNSSSTFSVCELQPEFYKFMHTVNVIDTVVTLVIPMVLIVVMNALIAKSLFVFSRTFKNPNYRRSSSIPMKTLRMAENNLMQERDSGQGSVSNASHPRSSNGSNGGGGGGRHHRGHHHHHHHHHQPASSSGNQDANNRIPTTEVVLGSSHQVLFHHQEAADQFNRMDDKLNYRNILSIRTQYSITKMLLLISTVFIMLNLPSYVMRLQVFIGDGMTSGPESSSTVWLLQQFLMLLYYTNFSINFLLYSTCGTTFRHCLCRLIRGKFDSLRCVIIRLCSSCRCSNTSPEQPNGPI